MITEIMGYCHCGEEEMELARSCGAEATSLLGRMLQGIPHDDYRVLVMTALANARVDRVLVDRGIGISIPAARPGRVTR